VSLQLIVCGNETLELVEATNQVFNISKVKGTSAVTYDLKGIWKASSTDCPISDFRVCDDALCLTWTTSTSFAINDSILTLSLDKPILNTVKYLTAVTSGGVMLPSPVNVLVCGGEVITLVSTSTKLMNEEMKTETKTMDVSTYFKNSISDCPITEYSMVGNGSGIAILTDKTLRINLSTAGTTEFAIKAATEGG
jgi:hypothetical protein